MPAKVTVTAEGVNETIRAFGRIEADLRPAANSELRTAARQCADDLVGRLRAAAGSSPTPVARLVAASVKVKSDRFPSVTIGGRGTLPNGGRLGAVVWGSERGGHNFAAAAGGSYWIGPTVTAFASSGAVAVFRRALYEIAHRHGVA